MLELNSKTSEIMSGKVIYMYEDVNEEGAYDFGELTDIIESLDLHTYTTIKEKIKEVVFQEIIDITADQSQQERLRNKQHQTSKTLKTVDL